MRINLKSHAHGDTIDLNCGTTCDINADVTSDNGAMTIDGTVIDTASGATLSATTDLLPWITLPAIVES